jgi:lysine/arginine/ornithine transport system substrate-binding protein
MPSISSPNFDRLIEVQSSGDGTERNALLCLSPPCATLDAVESLRHANSNAPAPQPLLFFLRDLCALGAMLFVLMVPGIVAAKEWKVIRFGVDPSYPPFESKAPDGSLIGFDIDLGNAICAKLNAKCVWVENDFDGMIPALQARKIDAILSDMSVTPKRLQQIDFTSKISDSPTRMVSKAGSNLLPTPESLKGKSIGVEQGTIQETYAKTYFEPNGVKVVSYQNQNQVYADLKSGRLDASLQDEVQAGVGFLKTPEGQGFEFAGPQIKDEKILGAAAAIGLRKNDTDLKNLINQALADLLEDGTYQAIAKKYFDFNIHGN